MQKEIRGKQDDWLKQHLIHLSETEERDRKLEEPGK
jgi:hypothetical protein